MEISVRINVTDPQELFDRAVESYMNTGGGKGADDAVAFIADRFGTRDDPKVTACAVEVVAEADHNALFEFLD